MTDPLDEFAALILKAPEAIEKALARANQELRGEEPSKATLSAEDLAEVTNYSTAYSILTRARAEVYILEGIKTRHILYHNSVVTLRALWAAYQARAAEEAIARAQEGDEEERPAKPGVIYFIRTGDFIKIGFTTNVVQRLSGIATSSPTPPVLLFTEAGTMADERGYHSRFAAQRTHREWFRLEGALADYIAERTR